MDRQRYQHRTHRSHNLIPNLTVEENIQLFAGLYGVAGDRFAARRDWVLQMAGLESHRHRPTGALALGWKQRLALGCAVLHEPPILFRDEPSELWLRAKTVLYGNEDLPRGGRRKTSKESRKT